MSKIREYPTTRFQRIGTIATLVCVAAYYIVLIVCWGAIPEEIPMHYNAAGEIDRMGGKSSIIAIALVLGILYLIFSAIQYMPLTWNMETKSKETLRKSHNIIRNMLISINFFLVVVFTYVTWCIACGERLGSWFAVVGSYGGLVLAGAFLIALYVVHKKDKEQNGKE